MIEQGTYFTGEQADVVLFAVVPIDATLEFVDRRRELVRFLASSAVLDPVSDVRLRLFQQQFVAIGRAGATDLFVNHAHRDLNQITEADVFLHYSGHEPIKVRHRLWSEGIFASEQAELLRILGIATQVQNDRAVLGGRQLRRKIDTEVCGRGDGAGVVHEVASAIHKEVTVERAFI
ncbi:hypothetical protein D9M70_495260 [compost metagenome]